MAKFYSFEEYFRNEPIYGGYKVFLKDISGFNCSSDVTTEPTQSPS